SAKANPAKNFAKLCRYFKYGHCAFGDKCHYSHEMPLAKATTTTEANDPQVASTASNFTAGTAEANEKLDNAVTNSEGTKVNNRKQNISTVRRYGGTVFRPRFVISGEKLGTPEQHALKRSDIAYLSRRFPGAVVCEVENNAAEIRFMYKISEPDWPFDVHSLNWIFTFPDGYPIQRGVLRLAEEYLPKILVIHIEKEMDAFLEDEYKKCKLKDVYETVSRKVVRWLDKSILHLFVDGLKKTKLVVEAESAGISLVMPSDVNEKADAKIDTHEDDSLQTSPSENDFEPDNDKSLDDDNDITVETTSAKEISTVSDDTVLKEGIEARISWKNLSGNIASISALSLAFQIKCIKCSCAGFMTCLGKQLTPSYCKQCKNRQTITFEPKIVHEFSNVIGILDVKGCRPVDCILLSSTVTITCLKCNTEAIIENLCYGIPYKTWCRNCHAKCEISVLSIRFFGNFRLIEQEATGIKKLEKSKKKPVSQVVLVDGQPLPDFGACKHYKKSFRWFRFPCCGKLYPCDQCHDQAEPDHEMKFANRIVCGYCSKEQPFLSNKPCAFCKNSVVNTKSSFWEGGKGCRNKVTMNRNDKRKYTNSGQKTISKKQLLLKENSKKKDE
uniref:C3H1-type domain-containing protein n=1 Tax=Syphacia muris TaxID=451379 RepID=A0A0N5AG60_9BILA